MRDAFASLVHLVTTLAIQPETFTIVFAYPSTSSNHGGQSDNEDAGTRSLFIPVICGPRWQQ